MGGADLALVRGAPDSTGGGRAVVLGHVDLELLGVGAGGRLPAAVLLGRVEVVGQVLGLRVAHFPVGGEAGFLLTGAHTRGKRLAGLSTRRGDGKVRGCGLLREKV